MDSIEAPSFGIIALKLGFANRQEVRVRTVQEIARSRLNITDQFDFRFSPQDAAEFYASKAEKKWFWPQMRAYSKGPWHCYVVEGQDVYTQSRAVVTALRETYGRNSHGIKYVGLNVAHASDNYETAVRELAIINRLIKN